MFDVLPDVNVVVSSTMSVPDVPAESCMVSDPAVARANVAVPDAAIVADAIAEAVIDPADAVPNPASVCVAKTVLPLSAVSASAGGVPA
jgi:hypothetical protein